MMGAGRSLVLSCTLAFACGQAEGRPPPAEGSVSAPRLPHHRVAIGTTGAVAEVFEVDLHHFRLAPALPSAGAKRAMVDTLRREHDAWLAINGTFFDEKGAALGLLQGTGGVLSSLRRADWGVLEITASGEARLVHTRDYKPRAAIEFAVQCGPRIVIDGRVPSLKPQKAQRTALCVTEAPSLVKIAVTRGRVEARAMGEWMAAPESRGGLACRDALMLDGGPSTQLSARTPEVELDLPGGWPVPNGIAVMPRTRAHGRS